MIYAIPTDTCYGLACPIADEEGFHRIYMMKGREFDKPLAILLRNYSELSSFTNITAEQLVFLSKYPYPFTLLVTPSEFFSYPGYMDRIRYSKIAFRIAEKCLPEDIREELPYPMFLTSANKSKESETYSSDEVAGVFAVWIDSMKIFDAVIEKKSLPSDIFEFIDTTTDIRYLRKNHN